MPMRPRGCVFVPQVLNEQFLGGMRFRGAAASSGDDTGPRPAGVSTNYQATPRLARCQGSYAPSKAARSREMARFIRYAKTCSLALSDEFLYRKRLVASDRQQQQSAANPPSTAPALKCVESQRTRRLIEARLRRRQVSPGSKGHRSGEVIRGGFMASGPARCHRR